MLIFAENCQKYWDKGLSVIPLRPGQKMPAINGHPTFSARAPNDEEKLAWVEHSPDGNIGLVLGQASGFVAIDVDSDDPIVLRIADQLLPWTPWKRIGARGFVVLYRYEGQQAFKIKSAAGGAEIMALMSTGTQIVLPPSIHPVTKRPYISNCELVDVLDQIPSLPIRFEEMVRDALEQAGVAVNKRGQGKITDFVASGGRDNQLVYFCGTMAMGVRRGEVTLKEAIGRSETWVESFTEKVWGDNIPAGKATMKVVEFLRKDVFGPQKWTLPTGWDDGLSDEDKVALNVADVGEAQRRLSFAEIDAELQNIVEQGLLAKNAVSTMDQVDRLLIKIAGNPDLNQMEIERLLRQIHEMTARTVTIPSMRKLLLDYRKGDVEGTNHAELAKLVIDQLERRGEIRCYNSDLWQWRGACWVKLDRGEIRGTIVDTCSNYPAGKRANDTTGILSTLCDITRCELQRVKLAGVNFVNGFLTEELELKPHDPDFGCTYILPYPYLPELAGKATLWLQMLTNYWGPDPDYAEKIEALQQAMAATMFGMGPKYEHCICLFGVADSGKSRILEVMVGLMPPEATGTVPPAKWKDKFSVASLAGKLLNVAGELSEKEKIPGDIFKQLIEGAPISAEFKYQNSFTFRSTAMHWFGSNHLPNSDDTSEGFTRRWMFLKFSRPVPMELRKPDYDQIVLEAEREAIAAWAVQGLAALKARGFYTLPASHIQVIGEVANKLNTVRFFIADLQAKGRILLGVDPHKGKPITSTSTERLYSEYRQFCLTSARVSHVTQQSFITRMEGLAYPLGFEVYHTRRGNLPIAEFKYLTLVAKTAA